MSQSVVTEGVAAAWHPQKSEAIVRILIIVIFVSSSQEVD
jgi:hypothetical protein